MKQTTINRILIGIITLMSLSICFLVVCIATRPRYINTSEQETTAIIEVPPDADISVSSTQDIAAASDTSVGSSTAADDNADTAMRGKTSTRVNIRDAASEDAKVLATVEEGTTFEIVEILDSGWTHIIYEDQDAYISSAYVIVINS